MGRTSGPSPARASKVQSAWRSCRSSPRCASPWFSLLHPPAPCPTASPHLLLRTSSLLPACGLWYCSLCCTRSRFHIEHPPVGPAGSRRRGSRLTAPPPARAGRARPDRNQRHPASGGSARPHRPRSSWRDRLPELRHPGTYNLQCLGSAPAQPARTASPLRPAPLWCSFVRCRACALWSTRRGM